MAIIDASRIDYMMHRIFFMLFCDLNQLLVDKEMPGKIRVGHCWSCE